MKQLRTEKEINDIISDVYKLKAEAEYTQEDLDWAKSVFKEPEDFHRLRRILRVIANNERGLFYQEDISTIAEGDDLKKFAVDVKINNLVHERIRNTLLNFFTLLQGEIRREKSAEIEKEEDEKKKENDKLKEMEKEADEERSPFGKNL